MDAPHPGGQPTVRRGEGGGSIPRQNLAFVQLLLEMPLETSAASELGTLPRINDKRANDLQAKFAARPFRAF
jgi:hypothetical protein